MAAARTVPTGVERTFDAEEIIVSKTDTKGIIQYANDVFQRVSGYTEEQLLGRPHNIVRHPDTPRGLFHLMWETVGAGREIFAYIDNLAADGAHYWVLAHITPTFGAGDEIVGFHSNRRLPARAAIARIEPVYARMCAEEARHRRAVDAAAASARLLSEELSRRGLTYDEFVWTLIDDRVTA